MTEFVRILLELGGSNYMKGQKRWEKAAVTGYENLRRLVHENFIPALDRFSVLASRLRGLSRFHETSASLGLDMQQLDQLFDTMDCLQLLAHTILVHASAELQQALAFSTWLRYELEAQTSGANSPGADASDKNAFLDYSKILDYIQGPLRNSPLFAMLDMPLLSDDAHDWSIRDEEEMIYPRFKAEVREGKWGEKGERQKPGIHSLLARLEQSCKMIFTRMAQTQRRNVRAGEAIILEDRLPDYYDARMTATVRFFSRLTIPS